MAVSGGQDSLCMARLLIDIKPHWNWELGLIHCDHQWRKDSTENAAHVLKLAAEWDVPAWCATADFAPHNEAEARNWRYKAFADCARKQKYGYIVCGHTMSDRAETILYNLVRGTGLDGIGTFPWQRPIDQLLPPVYLVRPLLSFSRTETGKFCQQHHLAVWEDSTNQSLQFRRNRIRNELLPYLHEHFNPQVEKVLAQTLEITAADVEFLEIQASSIYKDVVLQEGCTGRTITDTTAIETTSGHRQPADSWHIHQKQLSAKPLAMQRRVIKQVLRRALTQAPSFQHVEKVVSLLQAPNGKQCDPLPEGLIAQVCKPLLLIYKIKQ